MFERDFIKTVSVVESKYLIILRTIKIMCVIIDAINNGYVEFRAMIYSEHPCCYWSGLFEEAHFLVMSLLSLLCFASICLAI